YDRRAPALSSLYSGAVLRDLGPALSLPGVSATPAHAGRDGLLEPDAPVRPAADRIYLPLRPRDAQGSRIANPGPGESGVDPEFRRHLGRVVRVEQGTR